MGIKRARAVIREEFQSGGQWGGGGGGAVSPALKKVAIKKLQLVLLSFLNSLPLKMRL